MMSGSMNITEYEKGGMRFFAARTGAKDVVTVQGSLLGGHHFLPRESSMVPRVATALLDAGTSTRSKKEIRDELARRGARVSFSPGGDRTYFHAVCLPEDIDFVLKLIVDCVSDAVFPAAEITLQKKRTCAELAELKTDTGARASQEFMRTLYDPEHVNYSESIEEAIARTEKVTRAHALAYRKLLGKGGLILAITGDILPDTVLKKAERIFSSLPEGSAHTTPKRPNSKKQSALTTKVEIPNKETIDVCIGAALPITSDSSDFLAVKVLVDLLGGASLSTGHLSRTIRDRDGLTYGIYGSLIGFRGLADGALQIWATFSPATYDKAVEATKKEIGVFLKSGITEETLQAKKGELMGKYVVGLGTSGGLASMLHTIGVEGKPLSYIEEYPSLINALTVTDLKNATKLVPWDHFSIAAAGTFLKK